MANTTGTTQGAETTEARPRGSWDDDGPRLRYRLAALPPVPEREGFAELTPLAFYFHGEETGQG